MEFILYLFLPTRRMAFFQNGMIISVTVWFFLLFIFKALHFLNLCPIFVILFYFENVCVPILQSCAYWPTDKGQLIPKGLFFQFFQKTNETFLPQ